MWGSQFWLSASGAPASFNSNCSPNQTQQTETQGGVQLRVHQGELLFHHATIFARCCRLARQYLPNLRLEDIGDAHLNGNISSHDWIQRGLLQFASQAFNEADSCIMCRCAWDFSPKNMVWFYGKRPGPSLFTRASPEYITPLHPSLEGQVHLRWKFSHDLLILMQLERRVKFWRPQNFPLDSQQNSVAALPWTTQVDWDLFWNVLNNQQKHGCVYNQGSKLTPANPPNAG